jgi:hypothetical protein
MMPINLNNVYVFTKKTKKGDDMLTFRGKLLVLVLLILLDALIFYNLFLK